jgi:hypothetical protein
MLGLFSWMLGEDADLFDDYAQPPPLDLAASPYGAVPASMCSSVTFAKRLGSLSYTASDGSPHEARLADDGTTVVETSMVVRFLHASNAFVEEEYYRLHTNSVAWVKQIELEVALLRDDD